MTAPTRNHWGRVVLLGFTPVVALALIYAGRFTLGAFLSAYGLVSITRCVTQSWMAARVRARRPQLHKHHMISIIVTVLNEAPDLFDRAIASLANQNWPAHLIEIIVVDDGSDNSEANIATCIKYGTGYRWQPNAGKRAAMMRGFSLIHPASAYVLTGDSDTVWHPDAAAQLVATVASSRRIGAATGHVATLNPADSWLTQLTDVRYWTAFEVERAAQAAYGGVSCVSGPLGIYRRHLLDQVKQAFSTQTFMGRPCTFGDDRHLTNLILGLGYEVHYSRALAYTDCPSTFGRYLKQQTRWGRSYWREMLWSLKALPRQSVLFSLDLALSLVLPFLLLASLGWYLYLAVVEGPQTLWHFPAMVVGMSLLRAVPAMAATRDPRFLLLPVFALFQLFVLLPLKFWSLATVGRTGWGTRKAKAEPVVAVPEPVGAVA